MVNNITKKIAVCSRSFSKHPILRKELQSQFCDVKFNDEGLRLAGDSLIDFLFECDGAIVALETLDREILARLPNLKFVGKYGVGLDKLDFDALDEVNVKLGWTPGVNAQNVAEVTLALALLLIKKFPAANAAAQKGEWTQFKGRQLSTMTYGILGCGFVGKALVKLVSSFNTQILVHDIADYTEFYEAYGLKAVSLDELLSQSDILSIHVPKNAATKNIINEDNLALMKKSAYLINTARGGLVDEVALLAALDAKQLAGAAFDVLEIEPPDDLTFIHHPKIYVTTHIAGSSEEAILAMGRAAIHGLKNNYPAKKFAKYK